MINRFYLACAITFVLIFLSLLLRDLFFSIYVYIYYDELYINFYFKDAFKVTIIVWVPYFIISWLHYKYGKGSEYRKQKRLKEKLTYKIINERYREKEREKD